LSALIDKKIGNLAQNIHSDGLPRENRPRHTDKLDKNISWLGPSH